MAAISPDGRYLLGAAADPASIERESPNQAPPPVRLRVFDLEDGRAVTQEIERSYFFGFSQAEFSAENQWLALKTSWEFELCKIVFDTSVKWNCTLPLGREPIREFAFLDRGNQLAAVSLDGHLWAWKPDSKPPIPLMLPAGANLMGAKRIGRELFVDFAPGGQVLVEGPESVFHVVEALTGSVVFGPARVAIAAGDVPFARIDDVTLRPQGLLVAHFRDGIRYANLADRKSVLSPALLWERAFPATPSSSGTDTLLTFEQDDIIRRWRMPDRASSSESVIVPDAPGVLDAALSPDGSVVAFATGAYSGWERLSVRTIKGEELASSKFRRPQRSFALTVLPGGRIIGFNSEGPEGPKGRSGLQFMEIRKPTLQDIGFFPSTQFISALDEDEALVRTYPTCGILNLTKRTITQSFPDCSDASFDRESRVLTTLHFERGQISARFWREISSENWAEQSRVVFPQIERVNIVRPGPGAGKITTVGQLGLTVWNIKNANQPVKLRGWPLREQVQVVSYEGERVFIRSRDAIHQIILSKYDLVALKLSGSNPVPWPAGDSSVQFLSGGPQGLILKTVPLDLSLIPPWNRQENFSWGGALVEWQTKLGLRLTADLTTEPLSPAASATK